MEERWNDRKQEARHRFRLSLERFALKRLLGCREALQELRHNWEELCQRKKTLAHALKESGVDLDAEVLRASQPDWQDDEKSEKAPQRVEQELLEKQVLEPAALCGEPVGDGELADVPVPAGDPDGVRERVEAVRAKRLLRFGTVKVV